LAEIKPIPLKKESWFNFVDSPGSFRAILFLFVVLCSCGITLYTRKLPMELFWFMFAAISIYNIHRAVTAKAGRSQPLGIRIGAVRFWSCLIILGTFFGFLALEESINLYLFILAVYNFVIYYVLRYIIQLRDKAKV